MDALIKSILSDPETFLLRIYRDHRNAFIKWAVKNFSCREDDAKDVFQEVVITFYKKITDGKLTSLSSGVKTYLFAIGRFRLLDRIEKRGREVTFSDFEPIKGWEPFEDTMASKEEEEFVRETVKRFLDMQCEDCRKVLDMYYFQGMDMKTIARKMGYKNADVAKKKKYECFRKLAEMVKQHIILLVF